MKLITKKKSEFKILISLMIIMVILSQSAFAQNVSPLQTGHNMTDFINVRDMAKMAPGLDVILYNYYAKSNRYANKDGKIQNKVIIDTLNASLSLNISTIATVPAIYWGSKFTFLGGANYVVGIVPSYYWAKGNININQGGGNIDTLYSDNVEFKLSGLGDFFFTPLGLSWGWKHFDATFYYGITAPTGRYETGADDNIGLGFWTNQFQGYGYWYPNESQATAFMLGLTYELNGKIKGEDFKPGNRFSLEYGISHYIDERLEISIMGGNNWQTSDDTGSDVFYDPSYHDRLGSLAFGIAYWAVKERLYVAAKYMYDYGGRQRFLTHGMMINLIYVTNAMDGIKNKN